MKHKTNQHKEDALAALAAVRTLAGEMRFKYGQILHNLSEENEGWEWLLTGSRAFGTHAKDSDHNIIIRVYPVSPNCTKSEAMASAGFTHGQGALRTGAHPNGFKFVLKGKEFNPIFLTPVEFENWKRATIALDHEVQNSPESRDRVGIREVKIDAFEALLFGATDAKEEIRRAYAEWTFHDEEVF